MKIVVLGNTSQGFADWVRANFINAKLVINDNYQNALAHRGTYYTALGDLEFAQIRTLAAGADKIVWCNNLTWESKDKNTLSATIRLLNHLSHKHSIENFTGDTPDIFVPKITRKHQKPTLWTFGCSTTAGMGLINPSQECYGKLAADYFDMPWQNVARSGSSTHWSLTNLIHAPLRPDDFVIWGTTGAERIRRVVGPEVQEMTLSRGDKESVEFYNDYQISFNHRDLINTGTAILRNKCKFVLVSLLQNGPIWGELVMHFSKFPEWCGEFDTRKLDLGTDKIHMGPLAHQALAKQIRDHVYYINDYSI
jgi:hypothetical protein